MTDATIAAPASADYPLSPSSTRPALDRRVLRQRLFAAFGGILAIVAVAILGWWLWIGRNYVSTDDAYVDASVAQITPQVDGTISEVPVNDTMHVRRGQVLVRLDGADAQISYDEAQANYGEAVRRVRQYFANADAAAAQVSARNADLSRAIEDYNRRAGLAKSGAVSGDELTAARNALDTARAGLVAAQQTLASEEALIRGSDVDHNPEVLAAKAALDKAALDLSRTVIRAPFDGIVAQNTAQIGQRIKVGNDLMSVIPENSVYVDANFKESQLDRVRVGQPVSLTSDLYGSGVVFHGIVQGIGGGTGSALSVIPAENATGNWIKVVQRLPVRVALAPRELARHPLRIGLSMNATIDIAK